MPKVNPITKTSRNRGERASERSSFSTMTASGSERNLAGNR